MQEISRNNKRMEILELTVQVVDGKQRIYLVRPKQVADMAIDVTFFNQNLLAII